MNEISKHAIIEEGAVIGQNVSIEPWAFIDSKSVVGDGSKIMHHAVIKNTKIGKDGIVGQFTLLRSTTMHNGVVVGPHSEVARTEMFDGAVIAHKGTVVDCIIKKDAKIGPNFVTANFDFIKSKKFKTFINEGAMIGANVTVLAPITIGDHSIIGANSFINKDVDANKTVFNKKIRIEKDR